MKGCGEFREAEGIGTLCVHHLCGSGEHELLRGYEADVESIGAEQGDIGLDVGGVGRDASGVSTDLVGDVAGQDGGGAGRGRRTHTEEVDDAGLPDDVERVGSGGDWES